MKRPIENNSSPGQAVYDPFVGSGTTIIAAEMTCRVCHAIDLGTRKSHADALVGWHTDVVDDGPRPTPAGCRGRMRQIRDSGDQPHGSRETSDFCARRTLPKC